ncbi:hypothetical protein PBAL39_22120 [Pedobacter sp. BAL39]|nr:hypothetical protein PBAL39_22120 [Pedobacter sp. BAL39]
MFIQLLVLIYLMLSNNDILLKEVKLGRTNNSLLLLKASDD